MRGAAVGLDPPRLAVVQPARQFADDEHVGARQNLWLERPGRLETWPYPGRAQIRVEAERLSDTEQRRFGPTRRGAAIEGRIAYSTEEDGVSGPGRGERRIRQRRQLAPQRCGADDCLGQLEGMTESCRDSVQHFGRARDNLWSDAVAWKKKDDCVHWD